MKKKRTYNVGRVKRNNCYTAQEIADLFKIHKNVPLNWIKLGLPIIDRQKPFYIHGTQLIEFLRQRQSKRKHPCRADQFFCCKCRKPQTAWEKLVDIKIINPSKLQITGLCCVCNTRVHRVGTVKKLPNYRKIFVIQTMAGEHITDSESPSVMCDIRKDKNNETI